jgi:diaminohydroxyphosphoribosylaminopyrimidine deaminase/5-amino-6-(5-phosphoribosylamino)uracil reductase
VLAEGWHARRGEEHAERAALRKVGAPVPEDATLYVSLEPCAHHGRQPPCTDAVLAAGVRRVVIAQADTNPETAGIGPRVLTDAGVSVVWASAEIATAARRQIAGFHSLFERGRPYVTAKWAMTRNGRFATGDPDRRWISGAESRERVQRMRAGSGAIMVGVGTVIADDPRLTVRGPAADGMLVPPLRVVVDRSLRTPPDSWLARTARELPVLVAAAADASAQHEAALVECGVEVWRAAAGADDAAMLTGLLVELAEREVADLLVEAGPTLLTRMEQLGLLDRLACFVAPIEAPADEPGLDPGHPLRFAFHAPDLVTVVGEDRYAEVDLTR